MWMSISLEALLPTTKTGARIGNATYVAEGSFDKEWIAADRIPTSPFANNLYSVFVDFGQSTNSPVRFARSTNQGLNWTVNADNLSASGEGWTFPPEVA